MVWQDTLSSGAEHSGWGEGDENPFSQKGDDSWGISVFGDNLMVSQAINIKFFEE